MIAWEDRSILGSLVMIGNVSGSFVVGIRRVIPGIVGLV